jgi:hypothetical protein
MNGPALPRGLDHGRPFRSLRTPGTETRRNFFARFIPCNPLISLDSDERLQGNPRKPNRPNWGFRSENATDQGNPNGPTGRAFGLATGKDPNRLPSLGHAALYPEPALHSLEAGLAVDRRHAVQPFRERGGVRLEPGAHCGVGLQALVEDVAHQAIFNCGVKG